jgi:hypothetical protein
MGETEVRKSFGSQGKYVALGSISGKTIRKLLLEMGSKVKG